MYVWGGWGGQPIGVTGIFSLSLFNGWTPKKSKTRYEKQMMWWWCLALKSQFEFQDSFKILSQHKKFWITTHAIKLASKFLHIFRPFLIHVRQIRIIFIQRVIQSTCFVNLMHIFQAEPSVSMRPLIQFYFQIAMAQLVNPYDLSMAELSLYFKVLQCWTSAYTIFI